MTDRWASDDLGVGYSSQLVQICGHFHVRANGMLDTINNLNTQINLEEGGKEEFNRKVGFRNYCARFMHAVFPDLQPHRMSDAYAMALAEDWKIKKAYVESLPK